jgi:hypothetical protein
MPNAAASAGTGIQLAFVATENKALLWSLLQSHGIFEELPDKVFAAVNADFERVISDLRLNPHGQTLLELNKSVIANMMRAVDKYKVKPMAQAPDEVMRLTKLPAQQVDAKQKEFDNLINVPVPKKIDFADTTESDNSDMAQKLAEAIAWREKEFKEFLPTVKNIPRTLKISEEVPAPMLDEVLDEKGQVQSQTQGQVQAQQTQAQQAQAQQTQAQQTQAQQVQTVLNKKVNFVEEVTIIQMPEPIWHNIQQQLQRIEDKLNLLLLK